MLFGPDTMNAPWGLASRLKFVMLACDFFDLNNLVVSHTRIGKELPKGGTPHPLTVRDFLKYLEVSGAYPKTPNAFRVAQVIQKMASTQLLILTGHGNLAFAGLEDRYVSLATNVDVRRDLFRLVPMLGAEFLYQLCAPGLVHITGTNENDVEVAGTGVVIHPCYVLTCRHVVSDMTVDKQQIFQGKEFAVNKGSVYAHSKVDVAVVRVDGPPLSPLKGALFQAPVVAQFIRLVIRSFPASGMRL